MANKKPTTLVAFVPVIHRGYFDLFKKFPEKLVILGEEIIEEYVPLTRDLRVILPTELKKIVEGMKIFDDIVVGDRETLKKIAKEETEIIMPDEDVSRDVAKNYFGQSKVRFEKIFLRWDRLQTEGENIVSPDRKISREAKDLKFIKLALAEAEKSADWWRQIGAVVVKEEKVLFQSHNRHLPTDYHLATFGDPRSNFNKGERPDIYTSIHGEADIVAQAAKKGMSLRGASIYVTTFPCSNCARLLGEAGLKKVFYSKGYSRLDAEKVLKAYGIEIILVKK